MKTFFVTDIDGDDWSGTYAEFRAEVFRLNLPICHFCGARKQYDHYCLGMAQLCSQMSGTSGSIAPHAPVWHGDA